MEFVDGVLVERSMPNEFHSLLQAILLFHFRRFEKEYSLKVLPELRIQVTERARYRIPDILLASVPLKARKVLLDAPLVVIEILSPEDRQQDILDRFADYESIGVQHLIQLDPKQHVARRYQNGSLIRTDFQSLSLPGRPDLPFDSAAIFQQLRQEAAEAGLIEERH
jgi:Uma2 family endonuclease